jgi:glycosyltransferase involved in cell wall biosynthesis
VQLTIAGEFWADLQTIQSRVIALGIEEQVEILPRYHSDQETAQLFTRADVVVLPYRSATGSGVVPVAYHYNKPVIVTRVGGLPDVVHNNETGKVVEPDNVYALAHAIDSMTRKQAEAMLPAIVSFKQTMTWASLAATFFDM